MKYKSPGIKLFIEELSIRKMSERKPMTEKLILDAVKGKGFFGFLEVDIQDSRTSVFRVSPSL